MVHDFAAERETAVCGGSYRETVVYTSKSNSLKVTIVGVNNEDTPLHFLLKYQGMFYV